MKFGITERDELVILKYWAEDRYDNTLEIPESLKSTVSEEQVTNLLSYYPEAIEIENRIRELENKFQSKQEQNFFYLIKNI